MATSASATSSKQTVRIDSSNDRISSLNLLELKVLRYFNDNPGDRARYAADVLGIDRTEVNRILYGPLKRLCRQNKEHGWKITESARLELEKIDQQWVIHTNAT